MTKRRVLTEYQLERLKEHKYRSEGSSLLDPYMQPFWRWLVEQIPLTWAPNALTLSGLAGNVLSTVFLMIYCPAGQGEAPWWCYFLCALCLFIYQSLDAIDGKQARRTNSSSPLGELFDHGCDAMSIVIIIIGTCIGTQIGNSPYVFSLVTFVTMTIFFAAQWRTYATGVMKFGMLDVTEGQIAVISLYLANAVFGSAWWNYQLVAGLRVNTVLWLAGLVFGIFTLSCFIGTIVTSASSTNNDNFAVSTTLTPAAGAVPAAAKSPSTESFLDDRKKKRNNLLPIRYLPAVPLLIFYVFGFSCCFFSRSHLMEDNVVLYHMIFGIVATKLCCQVLVSYMTKTEMSCLDTIFFGPFVLLILQIFGVFQNELVILWMVFFYNLANLLVYFYRVCSDICDHLDIYCFRITPVAAPVLDSEGHNPATTAIANDVTRSAQNH